jgi:glutathione synthase/RimK-type ligase-like ATP-grasp enzyme
MKPKRILVFIRERPQNPEKNRNWEPFRRRLQELFGQEATVDMQGLRDLVYEVAPDELRVYDPESGRSITEYDLAVVRLVREEKARVASCALVLQQAGVPCNAAINYSGTYSKVSADFKLHGEGLPVIPSIFAAPGRLGEIAARQAPFDFPMIMKDVAGRRGEGNFLVNNMAEIAQHVQENPELEFMLQKFVKNDGDYRCLVFGGQLQLVIHRRATNGSHLNNTSRGGTAELIQPKDFPPEATRDAELAARSCKLEVAGVDVIFNQETGQHYILEVNGSPQLLTGAFPDEKMCAYADYLRQLLVEK